MAVDSRVNLAYGLVTTAPSPATSGTSMVVSNSTLWPTPPFNAIVHAAGASEAQIASSSEVVRCTVNSTGTWTITRATEGPNSARTIVIGDVVKAGVTAKTLDDIVALHKQGTLVAGVANYTGGVTNTLSYFVRGTAGTPVSDDDAVFLVEKIGNSTTGGSSTNPAMAGMARKYSTATDARINAVFGGADDVVGGASSFVEGGRFHGFLRTGADGHGAGYGVLGVAGTDSSINYDYLVGAEGQLYQQSGGDESATFSTSKFSAAFLASNSGTYKAGSGFLVNPFSTAVFRNGFTVGAGGADTVAFASYADTVIGLDLYAATGAGSQSYCAIRVPNNTPLMARNAADGNDLNFLYVNTSDQLALGSGTTGILPISKIKKRATSVVGGATATPTINTDLYDYVDITGQTVAITSFTTNLSGTPTAGDTLWISITGTASRALTWGATFEASTVALPTTTSSTTRLDVGFIWNASKWRCVATA